MIHVISHSAISDYSDIFSRDVAATSGKIGARYRFARLRQNPGFAAFRNSLIAGGRRGFDDFSLWVATTYMPALRLFFFFGSLAAPR